jgi:taurine dioxygenase
MSSPDPSEEKYAIAVHKLSGNLGAQVSGVNLNRLDSHTTNFIRDALTENLVLFFPRQGLSGDELVHFAELFGDIDVPHGGLQSQHGDPRVMVTARRGGEGVRNDMWHSDVSFDETPPSLSILQALEVPELGGDTLFASMYAAYDDLSVPIRNVVDNLQALHDGLPGFTYQVTGTPGGAERLRRLRQEAKSAIHPVVRKHPESGRKALYVNRLFTQRIVGISDIESRNLLNLLCEHAEQSSFQVRWRWSAGDLVLWDNRCVMHYAANDIGDADRVMWRVTLQGERPTA